ncbi:alanine/glycine:cation symporter family protein [Candidatus Dependentiae bacterium]
MNDQWCRFFLGVGILLTIKTGFLQFRAFPKFLKLLTGGAQKGEGGMKTIHPIHALFAALSTSLGMGNIISPSIAIMIGGPGALFWMVAYAFFAGIIKFTEVSFALHTRTKTADGQVISGPTQYLKLVHSWLANWYGIVIIAVFAVWSGVQSNTLAKIFAKEGIQAWQTGLALAFIVFIVLAGGAKRVGLFASRLVPLMCGLYISFAFLILFSNLPALKDALYLVFSHAFSPAAATGGFLGASVFAAMSAGIFKSIYTTEAGLGTSSIPHSVADVKNPTDQGILALFSVIADAFFSFVSGLLVLITGMWMVGEGALDSTLMYAVFKMRSPLALGRFVLVISIGLFVLTTVIGNSFNGTQSFASMTKHRWVWLYHLFTVLVIFFGALVGVPLVWKIVDLLIVLIAVPNVIGIAILAFKKPEVLRVWDKK